jgi:hypothetical protein
MDLRGVRFALHLVMPRSTNSTDDREDEVEARDVETADAADLDEREEDDRLPSAIDDDPKGKTADDDDDDDDPEDLDLDDLAAMEGPDA